MTAVDVVQVVDITTVEVVVVVTFKIVKVVNDKEFVAMRNLSFSVSVAKVEVAYAQTITKTNRTLFSSRILMF